MQDEHVDVIFVLFDFKVGKVSDGCFDFFCFVKGHHVVDILFEFVVIEGVDFVGGSDEYSDLWV